MIFPTVAFLDTKYRSFITCKIILYAKNSFRTSGFPTLLLIKEIANFICNDTNRFSKLIEILNGSNQILKDNEIDRKKTRKMKNGPCVIQTVEKMRELIYTKL